MKIYLGCDHQGAKIKENIKKYIEGNGFEVEISSLENYDTDDYPDFAYDVCQKVLANNGLGILICGSGIGMSIAANKIKGIRCARVVNEDDAFTCKNHNGANVIALSVNTPMSDIERIIDAFLVTKNPNEERHIRRINKVSQIEQGTYHA